MLKRLTILSLALTLLTGLVACGDDGSTNDGTASNNGSTNSNNAPTNGRNTGTIGSGLATFEEPLVESADIEGLAVLHSRPEQERFYQEGVFAKNHPIAFVIQMGWSSTGYDHPIYVGLVNKDRDKACLVGSQRVVYGGPETVEQDAESRTFVIQTHMPEHCGPEELGEGPYDVWVGANRLVAANPAISENDTIAPNGQALAFLKEGNVIIFGDSVTDLNGQARGADCNKLVPGVGQFELTDEACGAKITVNDSPGSNLLIDKMELDSSVSILTTSMVGDRKVCIQDKGRAMIQGSVDLAMYGQLPDGYGTDAFSNDLNGDIKIVQRLCPDDSGQEGDTRCDRGDRPWINMLVNPKGKSKRAAWNNDAIQDNFPGAPMGPPPVGEDELEMAGFDDVVSDMSYLGLNQIPQQLVLPRQACQSVQNALDQNRTGFVLETCIVPEGGANQQDRAFGGADDNCIRQTIEVAEHEITTELDVAAGPPQPKAKPNAPTTNDDGHSGGWFGVFNTNNEFSKSYGDSDWTKLEYNAGFAIAGGTDGMYVGAYFSEELDGEFDFELAGLEVYADAHDSSNDDGSEAVFEATVFGVSEGVGSSSANAFELRVSAFGGTVEKCVDEKFGWWVISIKIEGCASFSADVGGTLVGEFYLQNDNDNLEVRAGIVDVGPLVEAYMDGSIKVGDGCCSVSISGELDPLAYLSLGNDFYVIGEYDPTDIFGSVDFSFTADLVNMDMALVDGKIKLKVKFAGVSKSTKLINKDAWEWDATLYSFTYDI